MAVKCIITGDDYEKDFNIDRYMEAVYSSPAPAMAEMVDFCLNAFHDAFCDVAKTHKEHQKKYRDKRKEQNLDEWQRKERERARAYYQKKKGTLSKKDLNIRREKNKLSMRRKRQKEKESKDLETTERVNPSKNHSRKRISRAVATLKRKIKVLEARIQKLQKRNWTLEKRFSRMQNRPTKPAEDINNDLTPTRKTNLELKQCGIDPLKAPKMLVKRLKVFNCLLQSFRESSRCKKDQVAAIAGGILKKYRKVRYVGKEIGVDRRLLSKGKAKSKKSRLPHLMSSTKEKIHTFLSRDDNSTVLPGKYDYKKVGKEKIQKRVLNDYLANLWMKFKTENPEIKISLTLFCRCRPEHILLTSFTNRKRCLCIYHQNLALKLKAIYCTAHPNPDMTIQNKTDETIVADMETTLDTSVTYNTWKRQTMADGKKKMMCAADTQTKQEFIGAMKEDLVKFREHVIRVSNQYKQVQSLKEKLPIDHVAVHMDFAQNYCCTSMDEIQSAYWNQELVSLHPAVIYYRQPTSNALLHKSLVFVSDDISHNSSAITCIIEKMIPVIRELVSSVKCVHFISDSPVSQYRNRFIMFVVANFQAFYGLQYATWTYLETGHGKGPCDGIGGTIKRKADAAVRQNKAIIQNAEDFYKWASLERESKIDCIKYTSDDVERKRVLLQNTNISTIQNTLAVHAVCSLKQGTISVRNTSCFCDRCFSAGAMLCHCDGWKTHQIGIHRVKPLLPINKGTVVAIYTDEVNETYGYYLMKADGNDEVLEGNESDEWGASYSKGLSVVKGLYYERMGIHSYKLNTKKKALVPAESVLYCTDIRATVKLNLNPEIHDTIMELISQIQTSREP